MDAVKLQLEGLSQRLRAAEERWRPGGQTAAVEVVAAAAGPLRRRRLHEWLGVDGPADGSHGGRGAAGRWMPPMALLIDAATRAAQEGAGGLVVWIGREVWPYAVGLPAQVAAQSVMVEVTRRQDTVWAIDLALRSEAVTAVVADGSGLDLRATRRLQLAAEAGRSLALIARPGHEASQRSAAAYRWRVQACPSSSGCPRWEVEQLRGKDAAIAQGTAGAMEGRGSTRRILEWRHEGLIALPAVVVDRALEAKRRPA